MSTVTNAETVNATAETKKKQTKKNYREFLVANGKLAPDVKLTAVDCIPWDGIRGENDYRYSTTYAYAKDDFENDTWFYVFMSNIHMQAYYNACDKAKKAEANGGFLPVATKGTGTSKVKEKARVEVQEETIAKLIALGVFTTAEEARLALGFTTA